MAFPGTDRITSEISLGFDDVMIEPALSYVTAKQVSLDSFFSSNVSLKTPFALAHAGVDDAINAANLGSIAIISNDISVSKQADMVRQVKRHQSRIVTNIMTVTPETSIIEALEYKQRYDIGMMPVVEAGTNVFAGFLVFNDAIEYDGEKTVSQYISADPVLTVPEGTELEETYRLMQQEEKSFAAVLDLHGRCVALITMEDKQKAEKFPQATTDANGSLRVAAMVGTDDKEFDRVTALIDAGVDVIVVHAEHGHSKAALDIVTYIRRQRSGPVDVVVGNACTGSAALALIDAGANGVMMGNCDNYTALGIGVPQFSAILNASDAASIHHVPLTVSGITEIDTMAKTLAAGASVLMLKDLAELKELETQLRAALSYTGSANLAEFGSRTRFVRVK